MRIGIPTERKVHEYRVALTPAGVHRLSGSGHEVLVQAGAGVGSSITDEQYRDAGARIVATPEEVWAADLIRMELMDPSEAGEDLRMVARRQLKSGVAEHYHHRSATLTLARMANGDCCFLDSRSRRCTIYERRPDTCRNHPQIGPRSGYCAYMKKR